MIHYPYPITPAEVTTDLKKLCSKIAKDQMPLYIDVHPADGAISNECFTLVEAAIEKNGGHSLLGWTLWELPGVFLEAEFHSIWIKPTGEMTDITPKKRPVSKILFLPDNQAIYTGRQINNIRQATSSDPCVTQYLSTFDAQFELLNRGDRAYQHGEIILTDSEADEFQKIQIQQATLSPQVYRLVNMISAYTPCPCSSGKKVKWCHGAKNIDFYIASALSGKY